MILLHELGYRIAENQQSLTPLQRKFLVYGYVHLVKSIQQQINRTLSRFSHEPQERDLSELVHILPRADGGKEG